MTDNTFTPDYLKPALERLASIQKSLAERSPIQKSSSTPAARPALKPLLQEDDWESF